MTSMTRTLPELEKALDVMALDLAEGSTPEVAVCLLLLAAGRLARRFEMSPADLVLHFAKAMQVAAPAEETLL